MSERLYYDPRSHEGLVGLEAHYDTFNDGGDCCEEEGPKAGGREVPPACVQSMSWCCPNYAPPQSGRIKEVSICSPEEVGGRVEGLGRAVSKNSRVP
ncbi:hypothetical protein NL676_009990 [Syzygium grande]|nr:hypothetical protein NL676_009990 [Syzygium grande]